MKRLLFLAFLSLATQIQAQTVLVVDDDGGPGVDFTEVADAVGAAVDGDVILVRSGTYSELLDVAKGISIVADEGAAVVLDGIDIFSANGDSGLRIRDLGPGQVFFMRGIVCNGSGYVMGRHVLLENNTGAVWFEDCDLSASFLGGQEELDVDNCADVTLVRCIVDPSHASQCESNGELDCGNGIQMVNSNVYLFDCDVRGAEGSLNPFSSTTLGSSAAVVSGGSLYASGTSFTGGPGASTTLCISLPGDGGAGLFLSGDGATVRTLFSTFAGGEGGSAPAGGGCADGVMGPDMVEVGGDTLIPLFGFARSFSTPSPIRAGDDIVLTYTGLAGDLVFRGVNFGPGGNAFYLNALNGPVYTLTGLPPFMSFEGAIDGTGTLTKTVPGSLILVTDDSLHLIIQPGFVDGSGVNVSEPAQLVILDPSF